MGVDVHCSIIYGCRTEVPEDFEPTVNSFDREDTIHDLLILNDNHYEIVGAPMGYFDQIRWIGRLVLNNFCSEYGNDYWEIDCDKLLAIKQELCLDDLAGRLEGIGCKVLGSGLFVVDWCW